MNDIYIKSLIFSLLFTCLYSCENKEMKIAKGSLESDPQNFYKLPKDFQANKEIALLAIEKAPEIYKDIDIFLKEDEGFVIQAIQRNLQVFNLLSDRLKNNTTIFDLYRNKALGMLSTDQTLFDKLDAKLYDDLDIAMIAVKQDFNRYLKLSDRLKKDKNIFKTYIDIEMVYIKGGSFMMGSDEDSNEKPIHRVSVKDFYMSKTEVTVGQYRKCIDAEVCSKPDDKNSNESCNWGYSDRDDHPINCVDWKQARVFAKWVGGDLPSEAQWEYASRSGGRYIKYPWGNAESTCEYAVMGNPKDWPDESSWGCEQKKTWGVCSKTGGNTTQGLCDMGGNVWEWNFDLFSPTSAYRVGRGGSWTNGASHLRSADRDFYSPGVRYDLLGFRVARSVH